jgi:N-methylhydantoinase A/oxoprolinase/acetone carboxylase beta subunit
MVVKGDGSLVGAEVAALSPVETILSGPAASLVGAKHLSGEDTVIVSDMGGTTTDIAMLKNGRPVLNKEGATVGGWKTMVEAVAVHTYGLGGDSEARIDEHHGFTLGPRRVVPLSLLAMQYPAVLDTMRQQAESDEMVQYRGQFALRQRPLDTGASGLSAGQQQVWDRLADGPVALSDMIVGPAIARNLQRLVDRGLVVISSLTPSDAAHVLDLQTGWNRAAAELGARLFLKRTPQAGWHPPKDAETLCRDVVERVVLQSGRAILDAVINAQARIDDHRWGLLGRYLVQHSLSPKDTAPSDDLFDAVLSLKHPLLAIGAPVGSYYPEIAKRLSTRLVIPKFAEVSNAVGAVAGGIMQRVTAVITSPAEGQFRAHLASGIKDFHELEAACEHAREWATATATELAKAAGAAEIELFHERDDKIFEQPGGMKIFMESNIAATAFGRPALATA